MAQDKESYHSLWFEVTSGRISELPIFCPLSINSLRSVFSLVSGKRMRFIATGVCVKSPEYV